MKIPGTFATIVVAMLWADQSCFAQYMGGGGYQGPYQPRYQAQYQNQVAAGGTGFGGAYNNTSSGFYSVGQQRQPTYTNPPRTQPSQGNSTMQNLEHELNSIDTRNAWSRTPTVTATPQMQQVNQGSYRGAVPYNGAQYTPAAGMLPGITRRDIARVFFEGGSLFDGSAGAGGAAPAPSGSSQATSTAYSGYQRAENMATRARNAEWRTTGNDNKWTKQKAADEAYYDANDADAAANRAYYASQSGDSQAQGYARLARQAADRARADANRARYNADNAR
jgi:hypothetical protein